MPKKPTNAGKPWDPKDVKTLEKMAPTRPVGIIAYELGRTEASIRSKAHEEQISLNPPERSPYGRPKKKS